MRISDWSSDVCSSDLASSMNLSIAASPTAWATTRSRQLSVLHLLRPLITDTIGHELPRASTATNAREDSGLHTRIARRSEERRVGKECVSTCRSRWWRYH